MNERRIAVNLGIILPLLVAIGAVAAYVGLAMALRDLPEERDDRR